MGEKDDDYGRIGGLSVYFKNRLFSRKNEAIRDTTTLIEGICVDLKEGEKVRLPVKPTKHALKKSTTPFLQIFGQIPT